MLNKIDVGHGIKCYLICIGFAVTISETSTVSLAVTPELQTREAELVILGKVKAKSTDIKPFIAGSTDGTNVTYRTVDMILTTYELEKSFKQSVTESSITILTIGGTMPDGREFIHSKFFELLIGERFVAFLVYDKLNCL